MVAISSVLVAMQARAFAIVGQLKPVPLGLLQGAPQVAFPSHVPAVAPGQPTQYVKA